MHEMKWVGRGTARVSVREATSYDRLFRWQFGIWEMRVGMGNEGCDRFDPMFG